MDTDSHMNRPGRAALISSCRDAGLNLSRAAERLNGIGEGDQESIAGELDLEAGIGVDLFADDVVVLVDDRFPGRVAEAIGQEGRVFDIGEHDCQRLAVAGQQGRGEGASAARAERRAWRRHLTAEGTGARRGLRRRLAQP